jgi:hypothetical protein
MKHLSILSINTIVIMEKTPIFMEESSAQEFDGAKGLFLNETNKATESWSKIG